MYGSLSSVESTRAAMRAAAAREGGARNQRYTQQRLARSY
eukprot:COSAG02_NODE_61396_length_268_cov_1.497041_1_plen_39_part_01